MGLTALFQCESYQEQNMIEAIKKYPSIPVGMGIGAAVGVSACTTGVVVGLIKIPLTPIRVAWTCAEPFVQIALAPTHLLSFPVLGAVIGGMAQFGLSVVEKEQGVS